MLGEMAMDFLVVWCCISLLLGPLVGRRLARESMTLRDAHSTEVVS
jgi:hypothetical protein